MTPTVPPADGSDDQTTDGDRRGPGPHPGDPPHAIDLEGRVALVTGGSRGIGRAIAEALVAAGADVVITGRDGDAAAAAAREIEHVHRPASGGRAAGFAAHAGQAEAIDEVVAEVEDRFGGLDMLVNNAGTCPHFGPLLDAPDVLWDKTMDVNARGALRAAQACVPSMRRRGGGAIVNVSSIAGLVPQPNVGLYCMSKAALCMMTEVLAAELAADDIRVNAIAPGFVRTRFSRGMWDDPQERAKMLQDIPQQRLADPRDVAGAALYLLSDLSSFTTGTTLVVDGGQMVAMGRDRPSIDG